MVFRSNYVVNVGPQPKVSARLDHPIALAKPVEFKLDQPDGIFTYQLKIDGKNAKCKNESNKVTCDIKPLSLKQGAKYTYELDRTFNRLNSSNVTKGSLSLLPATSVIKTSIKADEVVYSKPKTFSFETDKQLISAKVSLNKIDNGKLVKIDTTTKLSGSTMELAIKNDLDRESKYVLSLDEAEGIDGSLLDSPNKVNFSDVWRTNCGKR
jgi:hypothetical protein